MLTVVVLGLFAPGFDVVLVAGFLLVDVGMLDAVCLASSIWGNRRVQPSRCAMERPHPRGTAFVITVDPRAR